jgi:acyl carrier protein
MSKPLNEKTIIEELSSILTGITGNSDFELSRKTLVNEIDGLDSFGLLNFILETEERFKVKISLEELLSTREIDYLVTQIENR